MKDLKPINLNNLTFEEKVSLKQLDRPATQLQITQDASSENKGYMQHFKVACNLYLNNI